MSLPVLPKTGDRGSIKDALWEIIDAAGGVEYSRSVFASASVDAQTEFGELLAHHPALAAPLWGGANVPAVYYAFGMVAAWTRAVEDRYADRLAPSLRQDQNLYIKVQRIRSSAQHIFTEARQFAGCSLHRYTPPYPDAGAKVVNGKLIYALPDDVTDRIDFRNNLRMSSNRDAAIAVEQYWSTVYRFTEELLDVFYPPP